MSGIKYHSGVVAQLGEQRACNAKVRGSSPLDSISGASEAGMLNGENYNRSGSIPEGSIGERCMLIGLVAIAVALLGLFIAWLYALKGE